MEETLSDTIKLFYGYAPPDKPLLEELEKYLIGLKREGLIESWSDLELGPGTTKEQEIDTHLNDADIILLLLSANFLDSDYCYNVLMKRALERHNAGEAYIVPILLRPIDWQDASLNKLSVLPFGNKPVTMWTHRDEAFRDIVQGVRKRLKDVWLRKGDTYYKAKRYQEALLAFDQAIQQDASFAPAYIRKGSLLHDLGKDQEAVVSFETAVKINPMDAYAHYLFGALLYDQKQYDHALSILERAIQLDHLLAPAYVYKALVLERMKDPQVARVIYDNYLALHPDDALVAYFRGELLERLDAKQFDNEIKSAVSNLASIGYKGFLSRSKRDEESTAVLLKMLYEVTGTLIHLLEQRYSRARNIKDDLGHPASLEGYISMLDGEVQDRLGNLFKMRKDRLTRQVELLEQIYEKMRSFPLLELPKLIEDWLVNQKTIVTLEAQQKESLGLLDALRHARS